MGYVCRGGKQYEYGTDDGTISSLKLNSSGSIVDVGLFPANPFGVYDMSGNVYECCNDWYSVYSDAPETDNTKGCVLGHSRVIRGIGWGNARYRNSADPENTGSSIGFRVVLP